MKMMMIQDGPLPTGADKPLRISGDPYKVQVHTHTHKHWLMGQRSTLLLLTGGQRAGAGGDPGQRRRLPVRTHRLRRPVGRIQPRRKLQTLARLAANASPVPRCPVPGPQVPVPRFAVGIVIGRNGEMIKKIQNDAGVRVQFKAGVTPVQPEARVGLAEP